MENQTLKETVTKLKERVIRIEVTLEDTREDLYLIKTNHLPHIEAKIDNLKMWLMGVLATAVISTFVLLFNMIVQLIR